MTGDDRKYCSSQSEVLKCVIKFLAKELHYIMRTQKTFSASITQAAMISIQGCVAAITKLADTLLKNSDKRVRESISISKGRWWGHISHKR